MCECVARALAPLHASQPPLQASKLPFGLPDRKHHDPPCKGIVCSDPGVFCLHPSNVCNVGGAAQPMCVVLRLLPTNTPRRWLARHSCVSSALHAFLE